LTLAHSLPYMHVSGHARLEVRADTWSGAWHACRDRMRATARDEGAPDHVLTARKRVDTAMLAEAHRRLVSYVAAAHTRLVSFRGDWTAVHGPQVLATLGGRCERLANLELRADHPWQLPDSFDVAALIDCVTRRRLSLRSVAIIGASLDASAFDHAASVRLVAALGNGPLMEELRLGVASESLVRSTTQPWWPGATLTSAILPDRDTCFARLRTLTLRLPSHSASLERPDLSMARSVTEMLAQSPLLEALELDIILPSAAAATAASVAAAPENARLAADRYVPPPVVCAHMRSLALRSTHDVPLRIVAPQLESLKLLGASHDTIAHLIAGTLRRRRDGGNNNSGDLDSSGDLKRSVGGSTDDADDGGDDHRNEGGRGTVKPASANDYSLLKCIHAAFDVYWRVVPSEHDRSREDESAEHDTLRQLLAGSVGSGCGQRGGPTEASTKFPRMVELRCEGDLGGRRLRALVAAFPRVRDFECRLAAGFSAYEMARIVAGQLGPRSSPMGDGGGDGGGGDQRNSPTEGDDGVKRNGGDGDGVGDGDGDVLGARKDGEDKSAGSSHGISVGAWSALESLTVAGRGSDMKTLKSQSSVKSVPPHTVHPDTLSAPTETVTLANLERLVWHIEGQSDESNPTHVDWLVAPRLRSLRVRASNHDKRRDT
jgi:hypothetical protein